MAAPAAGIADVFSFMSLISFSTAAEKAAVDGKELRPSMPHAIVPRIEIMTGP